MSQFAECRRTGSTPDGLPQQATFWSWDNGFAITDAAANPQSRVDGAAFTWANKRSFQNSGGQELAHSNQVLLARRSRYRIERDVHMVGEVTKEFNWFIQKFTLAQPGQNDFLMDDSGGCDSEVLL